MFGDRRRVVSDVEARERLKRGVNKLSNTVASTLGPKGRNVICQRVYNQSRITKDGVTVAGEFFLEDPVEDIGAQMIKEASKKTAEEAGDGTTTSTVLASAIINQGLNYIGENEKNNPIDVVAGIDIGLEYILKNLKAMSKPIEINSIELENVATISANNDRDLGKIVAKAVSEVGKNGKVIMEQSKNSTTSHSVIKGTIIEQGYIHPVFVTDSNKEEIVLTNPLIAVSNFKLTSKDHVKPMVQYAYENQRELLIIAEELEAEALSYMAENVTRGAIKAAIVRPPSVSNMRNFMLGDIAVITGGKFRDTVKGHNPIKFFHTYFGSADKVIIDRRQTVIINGKGNQEDKEERIKSIEKNIENSEKGIEDRHKDRLSKMFSGIATIYIGANSELEWKEKRDRVEDAILATQSALFEGIVPGGGNALNDCIDRNYEFAPKGKDEYAGYVILMYACIVPFSKILENAGKDPAEISEKCKKENKRYNCKTGKYIKDIIKEGIIDPTKVTRTALENAASVAKTLLLTDHVIYYHEGHLPESVKMDPGNVK